MKRKESEGRRKRRVKEGKKGKEKESKGRRKRWKGKEVEEGRSGWEGE